MRSLFLKIFLWFWATMVLIGLALVVFWSLQPEIVVSRWRGSTGEAVAMYAQMAAEELDRYGDTALQNYLQRLQTSAEIRAAMFDDKGGVIAGRASATAREMAARVAQTGDRETILSGTEAYAGQRAIGPSGRNYVFVAEMQRGGPFGAFRPGARTQLMRLTIAILISGLICYALAFYLTRPILRLRTASDRLAAGDLTARAGPEVARRRDELGDLVRDFNRMAERIEALITSQRQLISDISHELRSPLARLNVALGLARQRSGAEASPVLDRIEREAERLNEMIGRLLTLARIQTAQEPPQKEPVDLQELVSEVAADAAFEAQEHHCTVCVVAAEPCTTLGSPELLRSAVENVVRNAIRYTPPGTAVELTLAAPRDGHNWAEITVRDHGPGVPEAELRNVFRPFYRVTGARERETGGVGLGLAITERAVNLHGGTVQASNAPTGGLQVRIRVPADGVSPQRHRNAEK